MTRPHRFAKRVALGLIDVGNAKRYRTDEARPPRTAAEKYLIWGKEMFSEKLKELDSFSRFMETMKFNENFISNLIEQAFGKPIICLSKKSTHIFDTLLLKTAKRTLNSILICCSYGSFADSNVLIRKYRDDLFLYLFILEVLNNRKGLTDNEISQITQGEMDADRLYHIVVSTIGVISGGWRKDRNDKAVDAWFDNEASTGKFKKELSINNYLNYLKRNSEIEKCIMEHGLNDLWEEIRVRLNDYTHANGKKFLEHNLLERLSSEEINECIRQISERVSFITSVFLVFLILIKPDIIMASDYLDSVELGLKPPKDSQYWVAPFIIEYIDQIVVKFHPELKVFLHQNNKYGMLIESNS